jgi:hypothetical protein
MKKPAIAGFFLCPHFRMSLLASACQAGVFLELIHGCHELTGLMHIVAAWSSDTI